MHVVSPFCAVLLASASLAQNGLWAQLTFPISPSPRSGAAMVYDAGRDRLVLVGGQPGVGGQTWENDGAAWLLRTSSGPLLASDMAPAVYDSQRQRTVLVQFEAPNTKTWEWDGATWTLRTNSFTPPGRNGFGLAYDSIRGRTVLFGGIGNGGFQSDTWEWDGATWVQRASGGPSPRAWPAMAFDSVRGKTVLFGGRRDTAPSMTFGDTWEWNGQYWFEHFGAAGPAPRHRHAMVFDTARAVTVVHGGNNPSGGAAFTDTWEWNGVQWVNRHAPNAASELPSLAYDSARRRVVLFGGESPTYQVLGETWAYTVASPATITPYGAGCAGPTGVPLLAALPGSVPRLGATLQLRLSNLPTGGLNVPIGWVGFDDSQWNGIPLPLALAPLGFPGCSALLAPVSSYTLTNNAGTADWSLAIPFLPAFAGFEFFVQGSVFVLGFNPGGLVFSRALACTVGG